eukprot:Skav227941  [mRNA]  locus=scaffold146:513593:526447:+ [translate_table: standard]
MEGDMINVRIEALDIKEEKLKLSMKPSILEVGSDWHSGLISSIYRRGAPGAVVAVVLRNGDYETGFLPISQMSYDFATDFNSGSLLIGQEVKVKLLSFQNGNITLSMREASSKSPSTSSPRDLSVFAKIPRDKWILGCLARVARAGLFITLQLDGVQADALLRRAKAAGWDRVAFMIYDFDSMTLNPSWMEVFELPVARCKMHHDSSLRLPLKWRAVAFPELLEGIGNESLWMARPNRLVWGWFQLPPREKVALWDYRDILYTTELKVGPSAKPLRVMVDTGSSNLWLKEGVVKTAEVTARHLVHVTYGMGAVYGRAARDRMCLAALCVKQDFLLAFKVKGMGRSSNLFDGILGLAFPQMLDVGSRTFFQDLAAVGGFNSPGFGLFLRGLHKSSFLTLGEVPDLIQDAQEKASTTGVTLDVHGFETIAQQKEGEQGPLLFWLVEMDLRVYADASNAPLLELTGYGIVDSGTSLLLLPMPAYKQAMWALTFGLPEIDFHHGLVPCDGTKLNSLVFHFPGRNGELYLSLSSAELLLPAGESPIGKLCKIGISPLQDDGRTLPHMILGDVFLRKVYSIFDLQGATLTLVPSGPQLAAPAPEIATEMDHSDAFIGSIVLGTLVFAAVMMVFLEVCRVRKAREDAYYLQLPDGEGA